MNQGGDNRTLLVTPDAIQGRRRVAPKAIETSDVTRHRGVLLATALGAIGVAGATIGWSLAFGGSVGSSRTLSQPHTMAKVSCDSCHGGDDRPNERCIGCHQAHPSKRLPHRELTEAGIMRCDSCHPIHGLDAGVMFSADGSANRYVANSREKLEDPALWFQRSKDIAVPLVPASVCGTCHDLGSDRDPIAPCLLGASDDGLANVCFDEHKDLYTAMESGRIQAWEAARSIAGTTSSRAAAKTSASGNRGVLLLWLAAGLAPAGMALGASRLIARRRGRANKATQKLTKEMVMPAKVVRLPQINTNTCIGCNACVDACPYDVLEVHNYVATVVRPDDCCGLTLCEQKCPNGSLIVTDGEPITDRPRMDDDLQSQDTPGVYLAGDLTGLPLIRNAINQGAHVVGTIAESLRDRDARVHDLAIIGAGPAGISAALEAKRRQLNYIVLEQGGVAESIRSFPRGKLVFDQPLGLPMVGDLWLAKSTKEELLGKWMRVVHREQLRIQEHSRVTAVAKVGYGPPQGHFELRYVNPQGVEGSVAAKRILLAIGRRGSPRKLRVEIPPEMENNVHYSLADARSFAGKRTMVIGLGDVAMETAIALANQPDTLVTVSYRRSDFSRGKTKNIQETKRLAASGRIDLHFDTQVEHLAPGRVTLSSPGGPMPIDVDAVFVMIGTIPAWKFLESVGVHKMAGPENRPS